MGYMSSEYTLTTTQDSEPSLWCVNIRSMLSLAGALSMWNMEESDVEDAVEDEQYTTVAEADWNGNQGWHEEVISWHGYYKDSVDKSLEYDAGVWNTLHYINSIFARMSQKVSEMISSFSNNDIANSEFNEILSKIKSDEDFGKLTLVTLTRDQVMLGKALYDSISQPNRQYPYLPASKAMMINQAKNLATISNLGGLVRTNNSGRKRILAVGLPAGLVEYMRNKAIDEKNDIEFRQSNIICINVWRRNLLNEKEYSPPKKFYFDTSKFIIQGRATDTGISSDIIDAAEGWSEGQSIQDLYDNTVFRGYDPDGQQTSIIGSAYENPTGNVSINTFDIETNHRLDYYLKLYLMLTTGMDLSEDSFPFLESDVIFSEVDEGLEKTYDELAAQAAEMFPTRDVTSAINYDRLIGELRRSILLSPKKWRNRIVYPKLFDRVFCVLIDETYDFESTSDAQDSGKWNVKDDSKEPYTDPVTGDVVYANTNPNASEGNVAVSREDDLRDPTYYQFYTTVSLHYPISDGELETYETETYYTGQAMLADDIGVEAKFDTSFFANLF